MITEKFGFFFPENDQRFLASLEFNTAQEAIDYFRDKRSTWHVIPQVWDDLAAFLNPITGDIVVVRKLEQKEDAE